MTAPVSRPRSGWCLGLHIWTGDRTEWGATIEIGVDDGFGTLVWHAHGSDWYSRLVAAHIMALLGVAEH